MPWRRVEGSAAFTDSSPFTFSTTTYIDGGGSVDPSADTGDILIVAVLTNDELNALDPRPDNPSPSRPT